MVSITGIKQPGQEIEESGVQFVGFDDFRGNIKGVTLQWLRLVI